MTKAHTPTEMSKGQNDNTKTSPKSSITQRLRTDVGRSDGVTKSSNWCVKPVYGPQPLALVNAELCILIQKR